MDLTTLARVRALRGFPATDTANDALLGVLITSVSARAEALLGRHAETVERTEDYELPRGEKVVLLRGFPVTETTSVGMSNTSNDTDGTVLDVDDGYSLDAQAGIMRLFVSPTPWQPNYVRIAYTGGLGTDTDEVIAAFPAIAGSIDQQVVYEFARRALPGGGLESRDGSAVFRSDELNWLSGVRETLSLYARGGALS